MIQAISDVLNLPSLPAQQTKEFPECRGVYFVVSPGGKLLYVGKSTNLKNRFIAHHRRKQIYDTNAQVFYLEVAGDNDLEELESSLIMLLRPEWNGKERPIKPTVINGGSVSDENMLTMQQVSKLLRVQVWTVRRWIKEGSIKAYKSGRKILIKQSDLEKFLKPREGKQ